MARQGVARLLQHAPVWGAASMTVGFRGLAAMPCASSQAADEAYGASSSGDLEQATIARRLAEMSQASTSGDAAYPYPQAQSARRRLHCRTFPSLKLARSQGPLCVGRIPHPSAGVRSSTWRGNRSRLPDWTYSPTVSSALRSRLLIPRAILRDRLGDDTSACRRQHTYLRISLTERCNLRCHYCMPAEGVDLTPNQQLLTTEEIDRLARIFVEAGVDKIRLTGGEPTVRRDLVDISERLGRLPGLATLAMTTNGIALSRQLPALKRARLTALNISLDTLRADRFEHMTRRKGHDRVLQAIHSAVEHGFSVKVNVVLMRGQNDDEINDFVELTRSLPINVRFIEYMPFDDNAWTKNKMYTYREMMTVIQSAFGPLLRHNDPRGEVAKNFYLEGFRGSVSFITSMTEHFCSDCNRLRLMADGNLKVCLFGANEVSLRDAMREGATDDDLRVIISAAVKRKKAAHADMDVLVATKNRAMIKIGG